jgi:hypothetical protein
MPLTASLLVSPMMCTGKAISAGYVGKLAHPHISMTKEFLAHWQTLAPLSSFG